MSAERVTDILLLAVALAGFALGVALHKPPDGCGIHATPGRWDYAAYNACRARAGP